MTRSIGDVIELELEHIVVVHEDIEMVLFLNVIQQLVHRNGRIQTFGK